MINDWIKSTPNEFFNKSTNTKINIISAGNGYKVKITNLDTKTSEWSYKTGRTHSQAFEIAKDYMKEN